MSLPGKGLAARSAGASPSGSGGAFRAGYTDTIRVRGKPRMRIDTLAIVGVGLIGGSIGLAVKKRDLASRVVGVGRQSDTLRAALDRGAIDEVRDLRTAAANADFLVSCTPVQTIVSQVLEAASVCKPGAILTDAGSTKGIITSQLDQRLPSQIQYVGSHPLAGSEKRGVAHADADLFLNRVTVVTPTPRSNPDAVERVRLFWQSLGSRVEILTPLEHDRAVAMTSHLPHLLASALAGSLPVELRPLAASGFRDTTRIAAGDPESWTGILLQNQQAVLDALERFSSQLDGFRAALATGDEAALTSLLAQGKRARDALGS